LQSGGGDECPSFGHLAGHGREREGGALMVEVGGSVWRGKSWNFGKDWNFGKLEKLVACGGRKRNKEKGKRKRIDKEKIFSLT